MHHVVAVLLLACGALAVTLTGDRVDLSDGVFRLDESLEIDAVSLLASNVTFRWPPGDGRPKILFGRRLKEAAFYECRFEGPGQEASGEPALRLPELERVAVVNCTFSDTSTGVSLHCGSEVECVFRNNRSSSTKIGARIV